MRVEHFRLWLIFVTRDDAPDATNWLKVVAIVQAAHCDGTLAEECTQQTVVLILKMEGGIPGDCKLLMVEAETEADTKAEAVMRE